jgi:hypothetical protein
MAKILTYFGGDIDFDEPSPTEAKSIIIEVAESIKEGRDETTWKEQAVKNTALIRWASQFLEDKS